MAFSAQAIDVLQRDATVGLSARLFARPTLAKMIIAFVAACALGKVFAAWATGFTGDETYTIVIARTLALSYFDHPPLFMDSRLCSERHGGFVCHFCFWL